MKHKLKSRLNNFYIIFSLLLIIIMAICMIESKEIGFAFAFVIAIALTLSEINVKDVESDTMKLKEDNEKLSEENLKLKLLYYTKMKGGENVD